jgi:hypothetical protein
MDYEKFIQFEPSKAVPFAHRSSLCEILKDNLK